MRVRQAICLAMDRKAQIDSIFESVGAVNGPLPAALDDWALPIAQLGEGAKYYRHDPAEAKRLLAAAGHPNGFQASVCFATYGSTQLVDHMQLVLKQLKDVGIDARLDQKEYGAYQASCRLGKFDSLGFGPLTPFLEPDSFLFGQYYTGEPRNRSHVNDAVLDDLLVRQRRTADLKQRREVIHQIQRHLARQQYYIHVPSGNYIAVWDPAVRGYGPNLGYDYGGRMRRRGWSGEGDPPARLTPSTARRAGGARGHQEPQQQEEGAEPVHRRDTGKVRQLAEGRGAEPAQPERETENIPAASPTRPGRSSCAYTRMAEKAEAMIIAMSTQECRSRTVDVRKEQREGQRPQDREPHDGDVSHAVAHCAAREGAQHDAPEEGEQIELRRLDGQVELVDQIERVVRAEARAVHVLGKEQSHQDGHGQDDLPAGQRALAGAVASATAARGAGRAGARLRAYQAPTFSSTTMAISAAPENHAMFDWPCGTTTNAANRGPDAEPMFPPTWKRDWASP